MVATEIVLILIGVVFLVGSFFVSERLSQKDLEQITVMCEKDLQHIADKKVKEVKSQVEQSVEDIIDESLDITKRGLERETNKKIMAVSEYSDTVIETMNKTHNEIMFLYNMLMDKQSETADMVSDLQRVTKQLRELDVDSTLLRVESATAVKTVTEQYVQEPAEETVEESVIEEHLLTEEDLNANKNERILQLNKEGKDEVEIAKTLDCGLGEVRLVLGLYHEA